MRRRLSVAVVLLAAACSAAAEQPAPSPNPASSPGPSAPRDGGFVDGACVPTTKRDVEGVINTTGTFGHLGSPYVTAAGALVIVWRGADLETELAVRADRLDPSATKWVEWPPTKPKFAPVLGSPWGSPAYVHMKPIGDPGCWRLYPAGTSATDGFVIVVHAHH